MASVPPPELRPPAPGSAPDARPGLPRVDALDGLRAIAVLAVVLFHAALPWGAGGFFGVDVFFVLSGFLITSILLREWARAGTVSFVGFYARRVLRLAPALLLLLAAFTLYGGLVEHDWPWGRDLPVLLVYANWWEAVHWGAMEPITHTWSLALEWQFYLLWPPILVLALRRRAPVRAILVGVLAVASASAMLRAGAYLRGVPRGRLFYGLDTRADALLIGVALAFLLLPTGRLRSGAARRAGLAHALALVALLVLGALVLAVPVGAPLPYLGGFTLAALATAVLVAHVLVLPGAWLARGLSFAPLAYVGRISYGLYLWHYPVFELLDLEGLGWPYRLQVLVKLLLSIALAAFSFAVAERPFLRLRSRFRARTPARPDASSVPVRPTPAADPGAPPGA